MRKGNPTTVFGGICLAAFGLFFLSLGIRQLYLDWEFDGNVGRTTATIERLWMVSRGKNGTIYEARYSYEVEGRQVQEAESEIGLATYRQVHIGEQVPVKYLQRDPVKSRIDWPIEEQWNWRSGEIGTVFPLIFIAVSAFVAWRSWPRTTS